MAFTQQDMERQAQEFAAIQEEFSRLEAQEKALRKEAGMPEEGSDLDMNNLNPEQRKMVEAAQAEAKRAGEARATQCKASAAPSNAHRPGAGRRGVVRL